MYSSFELWPMQDKLFLVDFDIGRHASDPPFNHCCYHSHRQPFRHLCLIKISVLSCQIVMAPDIIPWIVDNIAISNYASRVWIWSEVCSVGCCCIVCGIVIEVATKSIHFGFEENRKWDGQIIHVVVDHKTIVPIEFDVTTIPINGEARHLHSQADNKPVNLNRFCWILQLAIYSCTLFDPTGFKYINCIFLSFASCTSNFPNKRFKFREKNKKCVRNI